MSPFLLIAGSVVVTRSAQFLGRGALRFCGEPADLGAEGRSAGTAGFGNDLGARDQFVESRTGFGSIGLLRTVLAGGDDQYAVSRRAIAG